MNNSSLAMVIILERERKENEPPMVNPIVLIEEQEVSHSVSSDGAFDWVKNFCHVVGLSCEGFEDQMLDLFTTIEANRHQNNLGSGTESCSKSLNIGDLELKRLVCSDNYDVKGGHRIRGLLKDWKADIVCLLETKLEYISRDVIHTLWG